MGLRNKRKIAAFLTFLYLAFPSFGYPQQTRGKGEIQEKREKLRELHRELRREREKVKKVIQKERSLSQELARIEKLLERKDREIKGLKIKLRENEGRIALLNKEIRSAERKLRKTKELLKQRLRTIYKLGNLGYLRLLLSAEDLNQMGKRIKYLQVIAKEDQRILKVYQNTISELDTKKRELEHQKTQLKKNQKELQESQREIADERRRRGVLLARLRDEKGGHLKTIKELEDASRQLQALIARLRAEEEVAKKKAAVIPPSPRDTKFAALKGKLPWPTGGTLITTYGRQEHPKFQTVTFSRGIGISAPEGKEILAVYEGVVLYADWFQGYGKLIILDHGGGYYTLYAHASELLVKQGDKVESRQVIAKVGDTGSLEGAQLYFEVRNKGKPEDPLSWLESKR